MSEQNSQDEGRRQSPIGASTPASFLMIFTPEQIRDHLKLLHADGDPCRKAGFNPKKHCSACGKGQKFIKPPSIHCTLCHREIRLGAPYYIFGEPALSSQLQDSASSWRLKPLHLCVNCCLRWLRCRFRPIRAEPEEWVQCSKCKRRQHPMCVLVNSESDFKDEYCCPHCILEQYQQHV